MSNRPRAALGLAALLALSSGAGGCAPQRSKEPREVAPPKKPPPERKPELDPDRPIPPGTDCSRAAAAKELAHFEEDSGLERVAAARRLSAMGELALGPLLDALEHAPGPRTRAMSAYTLGYMDDRRAVDPLGRALFDPVPDVRLDAAAALIRLGDDRGFKPLIDGLENSDARVRSRCIGILRDAVNSGLGYEPDGDPLERSAAVARWRGWLERRRTGNN